MRAAEQGHNDVLRHDIFGRDYDNYDAIVSGVMTQTEEFFRNSTRHQPSADMLGAMAAIPRTIFAIIEGKAEPAYYLSQLDAGVGKTTTLKYTIRAVRREGAILVRLGEIGIVLCLGRLSQIEQMIKGMDLADDEYAVLAAHGQKSQDDGPFKGNLLAGLGLGQARINEAPILLTTHAMIESRLTGRAWAEVREFFYRDKARKLRVWDESVFARKGITVDRYGLRAVEAHLREFSAMAERLVVEIDAANDGALLTVPDFAAQADLQTVWANLRPELRSVLNDTLQHLWYMSGKPARVRKEGNKGALVQYRTQLPNDIKPMLVLDASARVRATYRQQARADNDIVWLANANKKYSQVQVYFERRASGKEDFGKRYWQRLREVADIIKRHPDRKPLVLHHMTDRGKGIGDVETDLKALLQPHQGLRALPEKPDDPDVRFCHWGVHNATNSFADRDLVITASIFRAPAAALEAQGRAAANRPVHEEYTAEELKEIRHGEILHDLLQGLSRGALRNLNGDEAQGCLVFLRADDRSGVKGELPRLFPGCQVVTGWKEEDRGAKLPRRQQELVDWIGRQFQEGIEELAFPDIYHALGIAKNNFGVYIAAVKHRLTEMGLRIREGKPKMIIIPKHKI